MRKRTVLFFSGIGITVALVLFVVLVTQKKEVEKFYLEIPEQDIESISIQLTQIISSKDIVLDTADPKVIHELINVFRENQFALADPNAWAMGSAAYGFVKMKDSSGKVLIDIGFYDAMMMFSDKTKHFTEQYDFYWEGPMKNGHRTGQDPLVRELERICIDAKNHENS